MEDEKKKKKKNKPLRSVLFIVAATALVILSLLLLRCGSCKQQDAQPTQLQTAIATITMETSDGGSPDGAVVVIQNRNNTYRMTAERASVVFPEVVYGDYTITTRLTGYDDYSSPLNVNAPSITHTVRLNRQTATLTFDGNENSGGTVPTAITSPTGSQVTIPSASTMSRDRHRFTGWNTTADGTGTAFQAGETLTLNRNTTLYAQWEQTHTRTQRIYKITFHGNGHTGGEVPRSISRLEGAYIFLPREGMMTMEREGYWFYGWNGSADGTGEDFTGNHLVTMDRDRNLYAQWLLKPIEPIEEPEPEEEPEEEPEPEPEPKPKKDPRFAIFGGYTLSKINNEYSKYYDAHHGYHIGVSYDFPFKKFTLTPGLRLINKGHTHYDFDASYHYMDLFVNVGFFPQYKWRPYVGFSAGQLLFGKAAGYSYSMEEINLYTSALLGIDYHFHRHWFTGIEGDIGLGGITEDNGSEYNALLIKLGVKF